MGLFTQNCVTGTKIMLGYTFCITVIWSINLMIIHVLYNINKKKVKPIANDVFRALDRRIEGLWFYTEGRGNVSCVFPYSFWYFGSIQPD